MNKRLSDFIEYKTGGKQIEFANTMGWSPQYLAKLLKGDSFGVRPVLALLEKFPELNARWLLLGEGGMISNKQLESLKDRFVKLLEIDKYIPVMSPDEIRQLAEDNLEFDNETIMRWNTLLNNKNEQLQEIYKAALNKQEELCKQKTVKK